MNEIAIDKKIIDLKNNNVLGVFDWNQTIPADNNANLKAMNDVLATRGLPLMDRKKHLRFRLNSWEDYFRGLGLDYSDIKQVITQYKENFEVYSSGVRTRKGFKNLYNWMKENGYVPIILSNHNVSSINAHKERLGLNGMEVLANTGYFPEMRKVQRLENYLTENPHLRVGFVVGDSHEDIQVGKYFGAKTFAITYGDCPLEKVLKEKPDHIITNHNQIMEILR